MASGKRHQTTFLEAQLLSSPRKFSFEKAVDLIKSRNMGAVDHSIAKNSEKETVDSEAMLFRANPSLGFPPGDIDRINVLENGKFELVVNFLGLYGPSSPLPNYFTEAIIDETKRIEQSSLNSFFITDESQLNALINQITDHSRDKELDKEVRKKMEAGTLNSRVLTDEQLQLLRNGVSLRRVLSSEEVTEFKKGKLVLQVHLTAKSNQRDFLDLFNHRLISLYYKAQKKYHPESSQDPFIRQQYQKMLLSLIGAPSSELRESSHLNWQYLLKFSGLLAMNKGSPELICKVVSGYFDLPVTTVSVSEAVERQVSIPEFQRWRLGMDNTTLCKNTLIGESVADHQGKFRINISDLDIERFVRFLPFPPEQRTDYQGDQHDALIELCEFMKSPEQSFDICLKIKLTQKEQVAFSLGANPVNRLGWSCWLSNCLSDNNWAIIN